VFSNVYVASSSGGATPRDKPIPSCAPDSDCSYGYYGSNAVKITIADVSAEPPRVERELYYEGSYLSARRYQENGADVVRVVVQGGSEYNGLYQPQIQWYDAWGQPYAEEEIDSQLDEWVRRTSATIRKTDLRSWLPEAYEGKDGQKVELSRQCESYYVPAAGISEYGLTQVLSLDLTKPTAAPGGVTIVGATSTVYSSAAQLVLAQPDYRWGGPFGDLGVVDEQRSAVHVFDVSGARTAYRASGWIPGILPPSNPQFGIDTSKDGTLRFATTGWVRDEPSASPDSPAFWSQHPETRVFTAALSGHELHIIGKSGDLGLPQETIQSARFVGDRAYVVTFRQTDPLVVVDVHDPKAPTVLGQIKIPGFSQYMHPLDDGHLITVGQNAQRGIQLQLFDVSNPMAIPPPKVLDFGAGSSSEVSYSHKAFTLYEGVLAMPLSSYSNSKDAPFGHSYYTSQLLLTKVDANNGFTLLGTVDHSELYADNGLGTRCGACDQLGCYDYTCGYQPEVRRGHFVSGDGKTYVYSFSYAGVLVNDLADLAQPLASVGLPAPKGVGYRGPVDGDVLPLPPVRDGGVAIGVDGGGSTN
jgi:hypothetical protein